MSLISSFPIETPDTIGGHDQASSTPRPADLLRPPLLLARVGRILVGADADALAAWFDRLTMRGVGCWSGGSQEALSKAGW
jgi:hypothetical protein